ncbi:hypothetical protein EV426DRAFT_627295 [Tirmania nivea]|nr:hypothetical protein EV426DRAFT_627295 [Tirmania nivea]
MPTPHPFNIRKSRARVLAGRRSIPYHRKRQRGTHGNRGLEVQDEDGFYDTIVVARSPKFATSRTPIIETKFLRFDAEVSYTRESMARKGVDMEQLSKSTILWCDRSEDQCATSPPNAAIYQNISTEAEMDFESTHEQDYSSYIQYENYPFPPLSHLESSALSQALPPHGIPPRENITALPQQTTCSEAPATGTVESVSIQKRGSVLFAASVDGVLEVAVQLALGPDSIHLDTSSIHCIGETVGGGTLTAGSRIEAQHPSGDIQLGENAVYVDLDAREQASCPDPTPHVSPHHMQGLPNPVPNSGVPSCSLTKSTSSVTRLDTAPLSRGILKQAGRDSVPKFNSSTDKSKKFAIGQPSEAICMSTRPKKQKKRVHFSLYMNTLTPSEPLAATTTAPPESNPQHSFNLSSMNRIHRSTEEGVFRRLATSTIPKKPSPLRNVVLSEEPTEVAPSPPEQESSNTTCTTSDGPYKEIIHVFKNTSELDDTSIPDWIISRRQPPECKPCLITQPGDDTKPGVKETDYVERTPRDRYAEATQPGDDTEPGVKETDAVNNVEGTARDSYAVAVAQAVMRHLESMD